MPFTKISSELNITTLEEARDLLLKLQKRQQVFEEFLAEHYLYGGTVKAVFSPGEGLGSKQPARRSTSISPAPDNDRHNGWAAWFQKDSKSFFRPLALAVRGSCVYCNLLRGLVWDPNYFLYSQKAFFLQSAFLPSSLIIGLHVYCFPIVVYIFIFATYN